MSQSQANRVVDPTSDEEELENKFFEKSLRARSFAEMVGREKEVENLKILIEAAKKREEVIDHILLHGPPGLGKTSMAHIIAIESNSNIHTTSGAAIERKADLASLLTNLEEDSILFIDEIHRLNTSIEEILYSAMEDGSIDIIIGKGPSARTLKLELNNFAVIGATTRVDKLSAPLRDRFGVDLRLDYYSHEDLAQIIKQKADRMNIEIQDDAAYEIALRARRTPRIAQRLLRRVRDFAQVSEQSKVTNELAVEMLAKLGVDKYGLDRLDKKIIKTIVEQFDGGPVGIKTLSAAMTEDQDTIQDVYEPFLLKEGFIIRTPMGRKVTEKAIRYINDTP